MLALAFLPMTQEISRAQGDETKIIALENLISADRAAQDNP